MKSFLFILFTFLPCLLTTAYTDDRDKQTLRFKVSARALADKDPVGTSDPYAIISYMDDETKVERELGRTATKENDVNPDWDDVFTFAWERKKNARIHFVVYDHDVARNDDTLGYTWVSVNDYVDKNQYIQENLKKGYVIMKKA